MSMINEMDIIQEEIDRIYPGFAIGEQSTMVESDMKKWAVDQDMLSKDHIVWSKSYWKIIYEHAVARGWTQENFTGMEIYD